MRRGYTWLWRKVWSNTILADCLNWSRGSVLRFLEILLQNSMIMRVGHSVVQDAGHFSVCNYETYNSPRNAERSTHQATFKERYKESINKEKTHTPAFAKASAGLPVLAGRSFSEGWSPEILVEIYQQHNQSLPEVKALTSERLKKCRSRINQAVSNGCLEQYLSDFMAAVKKAQSTPFLRGEGVRGWRASFDWFVGNHVNIYGVLEGKYDTAFAKASACRHVHTLCADSSAGWPAEALAKAGRTSRGDPIYIPRQ